MLANIGTSKYKGFTLQKGQAIVTYPELSEMLGLTVQNIRTAINHLKSTGEITVKSTNKFSLVTIVNWEFYQSSSDEPTDKLTDNLTVNQQSTNSQLTRVIEEYKNLRIKEVKEDISLSAEPTPAEEVKNYYSEICNNLPSVRLLTDKRKKAIAALLKQLAIEDIKKGFEAINNSPFCCGSNNRGWKADFDFCIKADNLIKALEGKYSQNGKEATNATDNRKYGITV